MHRFRPLAIALVLSSSLAAVRAASAARPSGISLASGASLLEAIRALQASRGGAVVAEAPVKSRTLRQPLERADLPVALEAFSRDYDVYWEARAGSLALHRREYDPAELLNMEEEEIRRVSSDLARLIQPFVPDLRGNQETLQQNAFYHSLTEAQRAAMYSPNGMPFGALTPDQRRSWLAVNRAYGFSEVRRIVAPAARLFAGWKQWELMLRSSGERRIWYLYAADGTGHPNEDGAFLEPPRPGDQAPLPAARGAGSEIAAPPPPAPSWLQRPANLQAGEFSLAELTQNLGSAAQGSIDTPEYAEQRRLLVCAEGGTAAQVVQAIADLYGWTVVRGKGNRCRLERPTSGAARDAADLHAKIRRALPPAAQLWFTNHREYTWHQSATYAAGAEPLFQRLARLEKEGTARVRVSQLNPDLRRRIANLVFDQAYGDGLRRFASRPEPRPTLTRPETGWFTLRRGNGEGELPMLVFQVRYPDPRLMDQWGWAVGSSSLESGGN